MNSAGKMSKKLELVIVVALIAASPAWAGSQLESTRSTCGVLNCAGMTIRGIHQASEPFVIQVYGREGECLRLDVDVQTADMAMALLAPTVALGAFSDDRDAGDFRPLIAIDGLPWTGWYTVVVSYFDLATTVARFELDYGRYPAGNINCQAPPTVNGAAAQFKQLGAGTSKSFGPAISAIR